MNGDLVEGWKLAYRAYQLEPDNPEEISTLARTWVMLGNTDEAERLILKGLESSGQNSNLLGAYWMTLMVAKRYEEAESLVRELVQQMGAGIPASLERNFNFQLGLIALVRSDFPEARRLLTAAINDSDQAQYSGDDITSVMLASLASSKLGDDEEAQRQLAAAERRIQRGRLNGVDDSGIYYNEAVLLAMRNEPARAMQKLQEAYERGFREQWVMDIDGRLEPLRGQPEFVSLMQRISDDLEQARVEIESLSLAGN
jgi:tetratricopeptide (TPR) repeat protein